MWNLIPLIVESMTSLTGAVHGIYDLLQEQFVKSKTSILQEQYMESKTSYRSSL